MIELQNVSKVYRTPSSEVRALDDLTLSIEAGEFAAVSGPSGSGKSTLLALVGGLTRPTSGVVRVEGANLAAMSPAQRAAFRGERIGFVFQMFHLLPYLNVLENVLVVAGEDKAAAEKRARGLLETFGLAERLTHKPGELSAGERQRTAMARAMLNKPSLLLADEPTGNLDAESAKNVMQLVADYHAAGGTVLLVTHDERAASYAQRSIKFEKGRLITEAPAENAV